MKDHFGMEIFLDDRVLTATLGGSGTTYKIGTIILFGVDGLTRFLCKTLFSFAYMTF
jgi:hypothetical protein